MQSVEMQERPVDLSQQQYDDILAAGQLTPEKQHHGPPGGALYKVPDLYDMAASGRTILIFLSYHMVFFVMGVAGWLCFYYLKPPANGTSFGIFLEVFLNSVILAKVTFLQRNDDMYGSAVTKSALCVDLLQILIVNIKKLFWVQCGDSTTVSGPSSPALPFLHVHGPHGSATSASVRLSFTLCSSSYLRCACFLYGSVLCFVPYYCIGHIGYQSVGNLETLEQCP